MIKAMFDRNTAIRNVISEELDLFFDHKIDAASEFIHKSVPAQDYSSQALNKLFLSQKDFEEIAVNIRSRVQGQSGIREELPELDIRRITEHYEKVLSTIINQYKMTNHMTSVSEHVIDDSISMILGKLTASSLIELASGYAGIGSWLLAGNSRKAQTGRIRKNIFNHVKGMLINMKILMENEMLQEWTFDDPAENRIAG